MDNYNLLGGVFAKGKPLPDKLRQKVIEMARRNVAQYKISEQLQIARSTVSKIVKKFEKTGSSSPSRRSSKPRVMSEEVVALINELIAARPDIYPREIRRSLIQRVSPGNQVPSVTSIWNYVNRTFQQEEEELKREASCDEEGVEESPEPEPHIEPADPFAPQADEDDSLCSVYLYIDADDDAPDSELNRASSISDVEPKIEEAGENDEPADSVINNEPELEMPAQNPQMPTAFNVHHPTTEI